MIKLMCIKEPISSFIRLGEIYYALYEATSDGDLVYCIEDGRYLRQYWGRKYLIRYEEWLALEREKQIKTILDE